MVVTAEGREWGELTAERQENGVLFSVQGTRVERLWRVWGWSDGKEPLLIGVPEPEGERMVLRRSLSRQLLQSCGYWPTLPQRYMAGERFEPEAGTDGITRQVRGKRCCLSCRFDPKCAFPLAYAFAVCTVRDGRAELWLDEESGEAVVSP